MPVELKVPEVGESITEVQIGDWHKSEGDAVAVDEVLVEVETDKASVELPAVASGVLSKILKQAGDTAEVGEVIAYIDESAQPRDRGSSTGEAPSKAKRQPADDRASPPGAATASKPAGEAPSKAKRQPAVDRASPAGEALATESAGEAPLPAQRGRPAGAAASAAPAARAPQPAPAAPAAPRAAQASAPAPRAATDGLREEVVRMTPIRRRIAERLVEAQHTAALLTTFNEVDCSAVIKLRADHQAEFSSKHGVKLGFMSFFVKATVEALKQIPQLNAEIRDDNIVYRNYYHVGIAVSSDRGLVVPVLRDADRLSFAEIEHAIRDFAHRSQDNQVALEELQGGTFTITNGGVFGSLLSTPIVNPPQSGILGMHAVVDRPVAIDSQVVIRPMMYVALTYDHRIVDGREAVTFLRRIKEVVETPARMLIEA